MFKSISRRWKPLLIALSVVGIALSALSIPVTNPETGRWIPTPGVECEDPALVCVVWEFAGGGTSPPCCITPSELLANVPVCESFDFRD